MKQVIKYLFILACTAAAWVICLLILTAADNWLERTFPWTAP